MTQATRTSALACRIENREALLAFKLGCEQLPAQRSRSLVPALRLQQVWPGRVIISAGPGTGRITASTGTSPASTSAAAAVNPAQRGRRALIPRVHRPRLRPSAAFLRWRDNSQPSIRVVAGRPSGDLDQAGSRRPPPRSPGRKSASAAGRGTKFHWRIAVSRVARGPQRPAPASQADRMFDASAEHGLQVARLAPRTLLDLALSALDGSPISREASDEPGEGPDAWARRPAEHVRGNQAGRDRQSA